MRGLVHPLRRLPQPWRHLIDWVVTIAFAILFVLAFEAGVAQPYRIPSASMENALDIVMGPAGFELCVDSTLFADVDNSMTIAREEIFGPVITILGAKDEAEAVKIANDTPYGLAGYVTGDTVESARRVGKQIRAGNVNLQGVPNDRTAPFGGYKQSGNGREWGKYGLEEYLEVKAVAGYNAA